MSWYCGTMVLVLSDTQDIGSPSVESGLCHLPALILSPVRSRWMKKAEFTCSWYLPVSSSRFLEADDDDV